MNYKPLSPYSAKLALNKLGYDIEDTGPISESIFGIIVSIATDLKELQDKLAIIKLYKGDDNAPLQS